MYDPADYENYHRVESDYEKVLGHLSLNEIDEWIKDDFCVPVPINSDPNNYHYKLVCPDIESPKVRCEHNRDEGTVRRSVDKKEWEDFIEKVRQMKNGFEN